MKNYNPVIIIGAGIAGLCTSFYLTKNNISHIIIERGEIANTWITERWDNFHLVNPNWAIKIPDFGFGSKYFPNKNPDGYLNRIETINYIQDFASHIGSEIYTNENVEHLSKQNNEYIVKTSKRTLRSNIVIIASGAFGESYIPSINSELSDEVLQLHSTEYKNHNILPEGGVLVVGSGQSGAQIAEELLESGRDTWLAVSKCGRRPRRYKGKDSSWWNYETGSFNKTVDNTPFEQRWTCSPHTSGSRGGHDINLVDLEEKGLKLCGTVKLCNSDKILFNNNLYENLKFSDKHALNWAKKIDDYITVNKLEMPDEKITEDKRITKYKSNNYSHIDAPGTINSIIWSTGFRYNFDWIKFDVTDKLGHPIQKRGITNNKGLYFMGLQWMYSSKSAQFIGVAEDAEYVVNNIISNY